jgi:hypothetical protein
MNNQIHTGGLDQFRECIEACHECVMECENCATACLGEEDVKMMAACIRLDRSCADICSFAVREMARSSPFAKDVCRVCAAVCQACGDECAKHEADHCQSCARACQRCADACRRMAA